MPQGKGTYGSQVGRPSKKKKYEGGGSIDPFSTRNPDSFVTKQALEEIKNQSDIPTANAMERNQTSPMGDEVGTGVYKEGGKVREWQKESAKEAKGIALPQKEFWRGKEVKSPKKVDVSLSNQEKWFRKERNVKKRLQDKSSPKRKKKK